MAKPTKNGLYVMDLKDKYGRFKVVIKVEGNSYMPIRWIETSKFYHRYATEVIDNLPIPLIHLRDGRYHEDEQVTFTKLSKLGRLLYE